jgi:tRNA 2-thiouridine synthesizing protein E
MSIALGSPTRDESALTQLERDEEGFLLDAHDWHPDLIDAFAAEDELEMTAERHEVVDYIRNYFEKNLSVPEARTLLKHLQTVWGKDKATRRNLYQLFPRDYGQRSAGSPARCIPHKLILDV